MKKVILIAAMLLVVCTGIAVADTTNWTLGILATGTNGFIGDRWNVIGVWSTYTDALNSSSISFGGLKPGAEGTAPPSSSGLWAAVRQTTSPVGTVDMRSKYSTTVRQTKTWTMNVYWYSVNDTTGAVPGVITLQIKPDVDKAGAAITGTAGDLPDVDGQLKYFYDITLNGVTTTYTAAQLGTLNLEIANPGDSAHPTQLTVTVHTEVPEPGSLLALGSGVIGLIGFGIRRRR